MNRLVIVIVAAGCAAACAAQGPPVAAPHLAARELPSLERWRQHVTDEIMPFWLTEAALGVAGRQLPDVSL